MKKARSKLSRKRIFIYTIISLMIIAVGAFFISASLRESVEDIKNTTQVWLQDTSLKLAKVAGFSVENIQISGLRYTSKVDVLKVLNINYGDNIFGVDTETLLLSLKKIGWIEHITIQKKFPNTIDIVIQEYRPYALWQYKGNVVVITETGVVIPKADPKHFSDLMLVVGEKANLQCKGLFSILMDYPGFKDMITSAQFMHGRRWRLYFSSNVLVDLPEDNIGDTIHRIYALHQKQKILDRDVEIIDIRVPNKIIFKGTGIARKQKN
jgi:cell division protein FtsQ